jgi:DNA invertase Pin-like site-specific DNA recombinase
MATHYDIAILPARPRDKAKVEVAVLIIERWLLGRSLGELHTTVAMLKERGIALLSLEERIDTNSAAGELGFYVFGAIAHFERRLIAERTKGGIAAARAKGKHPGRRPLDADKIAAALSLVKAGLSPTAAAKQLGLGRSTSTARSIEPVLNATLPGPGH